MGWVYWLGWDGMGWVYWGLTPQQQPGSYRGGDYDDGDDDDDDDDEKAVKAVK